MVLVSCEERSRHLGNPTDVIVQTMASFDTGFPADSLEFCPSPLASDIFACGTYKLDNDTFSPGNERTNLQHRRGQCLLFRVQSNDASDQFLMYALAFKHEPQGSPCYSEQIQQCDLAAVLDMKWYPSPNPSPYVQYG
jgi:diphthamide biosynthesis protein 7